ncbi:hypothetical protein ACH5RR_037295 [Cinchona calisaya]|uniref:Uncharacterized protein n=1 Tax=Cinchona calisaya TaxID=153742 RepID=A0ABD2Y752_9GENT
MDMNLEKKKEENREIMKERKEEKRINRDGVQKELNRKKEEDKGHHTPSKPAMTIMSTASVAKDLNFTIDVVENNLATSNDLTTAQRFPATEEHCNVAAPTATAAPELSTSSFEARQLVTSSKGKTQLCTSQPQLCKLKRMTIQLLQDGNSLANMVLPPTTINSNDLDTINDNNEFDEVVDLGKPRNCC